MVSVAVTPIYSAILALLFLALSMRVITYRIDHRVSLGDNGDKSLLKRMRAQANCAEYAPIGLVLLLVVELQGQSALWLHGLGATLTIGRILHAWGFSASPPMFLLRRLGMVLTITHILLAAILLLYTGLI